MRNLCDNLEISVEYLWLISRIAQDLRNLCVVILVVSQNIGPRGAVVRCNLKIT